MSSTVEPLKVCSTCLELVSPTDLECRYCGKQLKIATNKYFVAPDYIYHQRHTLLEELEPDKSKLGEEEYKKKLSDIQEHLDSWSRDCPSDDRVAAMTDAYMLLAHVIHSQSRREDINHLTSIAKKIGELANSIEQYFKSGGTTFDRKTRSLRPDIGDDTWNQASATAGRNP